MSDNDIFNSGIYKHVRRNFTGISTVFFKIKIFCPNIYITSLYCINNRYNVNCRYTKYNINIIIFHQRKQFVYKCNCFTWCFIHFPVSCDNSSS